MYVVRKYSIMIDGQFLLWCFAVPVLYTAGVGIYGCIGTCTYMCVCMHGLPCGGMSAFYVYNSASKRVFACKKTHVKPHQHTDAHTIACTHVQGTLLMCEVHMHLDDLE